MPTLKEYSTALERFHVSAARRSPGRALLKQKEKWFFEEEMRKKKDKKRRRRKEEDIKEGKKE
jgi:hypothetical protein